MASSAGALARAAVSRFDGAILQEVSPAKTQNGKRPLMLPRCAKNAGQTERWNGSPRFSAMASEKSSATGNLGRPCQATGAVD
jgi:hypothetical protein